MPLTKYEKDRARVTAMSDQAWAMWESNLSAIERISRGEIVPSDFPIIQGIASLVAGDMHLRRAGRGIDESNSR